FQPAFLQDSKESRILVDLVFRSAVLSTYLDYRFQTHEGRPWRFPFYRCRVWRGVLRRNGRVVMQRIANPCTPVRFRVAPPVFMRAPEQFFPVIGRSGIHYTPTSTK